MDRPVPNRHAGPVRVIGDDVAELKTDFREIRGRVAILAANYASVSFRVDRLGDRLERIERRLDLVEA
jgi:hypothetical protein